MLPNVSLQRCYRHLKEDLHRRSRSGQPSIPLYEKLVRFPKCRNASRIADTLYDTLPTDSDLRRIPKHHLAAAYLPAEVCTHGERTSNAAESFNGMCLQVRESESLYRSLLSTLQLLDRRRVSLRSSMASMSINAGYGELSTEFADPPRMQNEYSSLRQFAMTLSCERCHDNLDVDTQRTFLVESSAGGALTSHAAAAALGSGFKWRVSIDAYLEGKFERACDCGKTSSRLTACEHVIRALSACRDTKVEEYRKPWQVRMIIPSFLAK